MRFERDDLVEILRLSKQENYKSRKIASIYGCSKSTINYFLKRKTYLDFWEEYTKKPIAGGNVIPKLSVRQNISTLTKKKTYLFTSAQNNTYIHDKFWKSLMKCADYYDAEIIISTFTYNKSGFQNLTKQSDDIWYDPKIRDYICNDSLQVCDDLVFCGELNILPTAVNPTSGFSNYTNDSSCIIPHPKMVLEPIETSKHKEPKHIYTTCAVTQSNYIEKTAGQKATEHHIYGALLVEVNEYGDWFARQLHAESSTGEFYDLTNKFTPNGVSTGHRVLGINWGDVHVEKLDRIAGAVSFGVSLETEGHLPHQVQCDNMLDDLKPEYSIYNDIIDFKVRNHHNRHDPLFKIKMFNDDTEEVKFGLQQCAKLLELTSRPWCQQVVVNSNHDAALKKWCLEADWKHDPVNAEFLLSCQLALVKATLRKDNDYCIFESYIKSINHNTQGVNFLRLDESFMLGDITYGIECGYHSHTGLNGARGSINSYKRAGLRYNIGHGHCARILNGVFMAGVIGKKDMGYNIGLSGWSHSNIITYPNTKRAIVTIKNGEYKVNRK